MAMWSMRKQTFKDQLSCKISKIGKKKNIFSKLNKSLNKCNYHQHVIYSGDQEIEPPMGPTESGPILESARFVKPANYKMEKY